MAASASVAGVTSGVLLTQVSESLVLCASGPVTWILSANVSLLFLRLVAVKISCVQHVTVFFIWESKRSDRISRTKDLYRRREDKLQLECGRVESSVYNNGHF